MRTSEQCFSAIADYSYFWEIWVNPAGRPVWTNPAVQRVMGYTVKELMSIPDYPAPLIYEQDRQRICKAFKSALEGSIGNEVPFRLVRKDGAIVWAEASWKPIYDNKNIFIGYRTTIHDITDRKKAEESLHASEQKFRLMFETSPLGMVLCEMDGTFVHANRAYLDIIGYPHEEAIKLSYWDVTPRDYDTNEAKQLRAMKETGRYGPYEKEYIRKTGQRVPVLLNGMVVKDANGVERIWSIVEDITDRKVAEETRLNLHKELEIKNKELESILYAASHDLKSPLVNIQGFSYELAGSCDLIRSTLATDEKNPEIKKTLDTALNKDIPEALDFILTSTSKMDLLLTGLLDLCRLGNAEKKIETIDMNAMIADVAASMEYQIKEAAAKVEFESLVSCLGDVPQISRVFSNLLTNAIKFLDKSRQGHIRIYSSRQDNQNIYCIEDNGIGIAPEYHEMIFEIFYQLEPDRIKGDGLGLTIVKRIIDRHNGQVWVESEAGKGSKFFVSLPCL